MTPVNGQLRRLRSHQDDFSSLFLPDGPGHASRTALRTVAPAGTLVLLRSLLCSESIQPSRGAQRLLLACHAEKFPFVSVVKGSWRLLRASSAPTDMVA